MIGSMDRRRHDGPSSPYVVPHIEFFLETFFSNSLLQSNDQDDGPLSARQSVVGFRFKTLRIFSRRKLGLLVVSNEGCAGCSIKEMVVR